MGAKLTRFTESVNRTRRRVSTSVNNKGGSGSGSGPSAAAVLNGAPAEHDHHDRACGTGSDGEGEGEGRGRDGGGGARNSLEHHNHETGHDPALHGAKLEDRNYNNESFKKRTVDPSDPHQQQAAVTIQTQFRQHSAKDEVQTMREEDAATRIQAGFRGFIDREQVRTMKGDEDTAAEGQAEEEVDIDLNDPEVEKAAIKIQAGFKGFKARKDVQGKEEGGEEAAEAPRPASAEKQEAAEEEVDIDLNDPDVAQAALKIQAGFRGHQARQEVMAHKPSKMPHSSAPTPPTNPISGPTHSSPTPAPAPKAAHADAPLPAKTQAQQDEEDIANIDLRDPDLASAALKIQAGFRGIKSRKKVQDKKAEQDAQQKTDSPRLEPEPEVQEQAAPEEEEIDIDLNDPDVEKAAVKIQAGFKGLKARKGLRQKEEDAPAAEPAPAEPSSEQTTEAAAAAPPAEEEVDIDLEDPATEKAALKIQASFRGFQTRRDMAGKSQEEGGDQQQGQPEGEQTQAAAEQEVAQAQEGEEPQAKEPEGEPAPGAEEAAEKKPDEEEVDIDLEDPEVEKAAMKIQAGFKGFKARKEIQEKKGGEADTVDGAPAASVDAQEQEATAEGSKVEEEGQGQEQVAASEEDTQPKEVVEGEGQAAEEVQKPAEGEGEAQAEAPAEAAADDKGEEAKGQQEEEVVDIDLEDPEVEKAALKIQAQFKGFKSRKTAKKEDDVEDGQ